MAKLFHPVESVRPMKTLERILYVVLIFCALMVGRYFSPQQINGVVHVCRNSIIYGDLDKDGKTVLDTISTSFYISGEYAFVEIPGISSDEINDIKKLQDVGDTFFDNISIKNNKVYYFSKHLEDIISSSKIDISNYEKVIRKNLLKYKVLCEWM